MPMRPRRAVINLPPPAAAGEDAPRTGRYGEQDESGHGTLRDDAARVAGILNRIERLGNSLPHPAALFAGPGPWGSPSLGPRRSPELVGNPSRHRRRGQGNQPPRRPRNPPHARGNGQELHQLRTPWHRARRYAGPRHCGTLRPSRGSPWLASSARLDPPSSAFLWYLPGCSPASPPPTQAMWY